MRIQRAALGIPKRKRAPPVKPTAWLRSTPWSTKFLTHSSTVEIIDVSAANNEQENITIVRNIISQENADESLMEHISDRPGHDRRYAMGFEKANRLLGWKPEIDWDNGLSETIEWYRLNTAWIDSITSGQYQEYIRKQYDSL